MQKKDQQKWKEKESVEEHDQVDSNAKHQLFQAKKGDAQKSVRKRKAKGTELSPSMAPDLNLPVTGSSVLVPVGIVSARVNQLDGNQDVQVDWGDEFLKKQFHECATGGGYD